MATPASLDRGILALADRDGKTKRGTNQSRVDYSAVKAQLIKEYYDPLTKDTPTEVRYINEIMGKGMFATRDIEEGEVIYWEEPLVQSHDNGDECYACDNCIRYLGPVPGSDEYSDEEDAYETWFCLDGCNERYCSARCRKAARQKHHKLLCTGEAGKRTPRQIAANTFYNFAIERMEGLHWPTAVRILAGLVIAWKENGKDWRDAYIDIGMFRQTPFWMSPVYKPKKDLPPELRARYGIENAKHNTTVAVQLLRATMLEPGLPEEIFTVEFFAGLIGIVDLNCHGGEFKSPVRDKKHRDYDKRSTAACLFILAPTANHSCEPNTDMTFAKDARGEYARVGWKALRDIKEGEEITASYLHPDYKHYEDRTKILQDDYLFTCMCPLCVRERAEIERKSATKQTKKKIPKASSSSRSDSESD